MSRIVGSKWTYPFVLLPLFSHAVILLLDPILHPYSSRLGEGSLKLRSWILERLVKMIRLNQPRA